MYFGVPWVSGAIHTETKPYPIYKQNLTQYILKLNIMIFDYTMRLMKLNLQIIKKRL